MMESPSRETSIQPLCRGRWPVRLGPRPARTCAVLLIADVLQPVHQLPIQRLLNCDMRQGRFWRGAMPMLLSGREPDNVAGMNFFDRAALALHPAAAARHDQSLTER